MAFAELAARSCFSFLEGASQPAELVAAAAELGLSAIAIADRGGLYGLARALKAARGLGERGPRLIVGAEPVLEGERGALVLLAQDARGYENLCRLITLSHADRPKGQAALPLGALALHSAGLLALLEPPCSDRLAGAVREAFGDRAYALSSRRLLSSDGASERAALRLSKRFGMRVVASARPLMHEPGRRRVADVLSCIRLGTTLDKAGRRLLPNAEAYLRSEAAMRKLFRDRPGWVEQAAEAAGRCSFSLSELRYSFPCALCGPGEAPDRALARLVEEHLPWRYPGGTPPAVASQIERELSLIAKIGVAPYFLSVVEIVQIARSLGVLCQGRGSAANSAVCYVLGVTSVDPARSCLLFERFLSEERGEPPDIDVDFEHERREEVIQAIYQRYGRDRAAMVSEVISYRSKSALREVGKAFGMALEQVDRLSDAASGGGELTPGRLREVGLDPSADRVMQVIEIAREMQGFPRHLSIHVGGFVLSAGPLSAVAPIEPARMAGRTVVQWDKDDLDTLGFFKVDVLALGMLTAVRKGLELVHEQGEPPEPGASRPPFEPLSALAAIPPEDPLVYQSFCEADTVGVFQIESRAQQAMLPTLRPKAFYDLVVEVALVRPGPIQGGMVHPYLRRRRGQEPVVCPHACLEPILARTLGVPLFQEQVMQIAIAGAGYSGGEADELRRDMAAWKKTGLLERHRQKLIEGFARQGIGEHFGEALYRQIQGFGDYGFPECVVGDTRVIDADTGRLVTIEDVVTGRATLRHTLTCSDDLRIERRRVVDARPSGEKPVFRLKTALGRQIEATAEHPFLTVSGWKKLGQLRAGDAVATPRSLPTLGKRRWPRHRIIVLADLVAEGNLCHPSTFYFYTSDQEHCDEFIRSVEQFPNTRAVVARHKSCFSVHVRRVDRSRLSGAVEWAEGLGLRGRGSHDKAIPAEVFELAGSCIALLLARLWDGDGHLSMSGAHASYDTVSRRLADDVQHLLLKLGIVSRIYERDRPYRGRTVRCHVVTVTGVDNLRRFGRLIGRRLIIAEKRERAARLAAGAGSRRSSRDVVPAEIRAVVQRARERAGVPWGAVEREAGVSVKEMYGSGGASKRGFRRWVIGRLARYFGSEELSRLATSDLYWDRVTSIEPVGVRQTYDLEIEGNHNFIANDFIVHNSHSASFALIVYASGWLKVHYPAAFACALLNSQPMGFYSPSSLVQDAQRHGVEVRDVSVSESSWDSTLEWAESASRASRAGRAQPAMRLGFRILRGMPEAKARALCEARAARPFADIDDLIRRGCLGRREVEILAEAGALEPLLPGRREALWKARAPRVGGLFGSVPVDEPAPSLPLLSPAERLALDYRHKGLSVDDHPMRHIRPLLPPGIRRSSELVRLADGEKTAVAGLVQSRQRPGTASGVVFVTLEDETGTCNVVLWSSVFERHRFVAVHAMALLVRGRVERRGPVVHLVAESLERVDGRAMPERLVSRDFH